MKKYGARPKNASTNRPGMMHSTRPMPTMRPYTIENDDPLAPSVVLERLADIGGFAGRDHQAPCGRRRVQRSCSTTHADDLERARRRRSRPITTLSEDARSRSARRTGMKMTANTGPTFAKYLFKPYDERAADVGGSRTGRGRTVRRGRGRRNVVHESSSVRISRDANASKAARRGPRTERLSRPATRTGAGGAWPPPASAPSPGAGSSRPLRRAG